MKDLKKMSDEIYIIGTRGIAEFLINNYSDVAMIRGFVDSSESSIGGGVFK